MFRMYASNYHSYTHLIRALGIVREPTVCWFVTSEYPGIHDIGLPIHVQRYIEPRGTRSIPDSCQPHEAWHHSRETVHS